MWKATGCSDICKEALICREGMERARKVRDRAGQRAAATARSSDAAREAERVKLAERVRGTETRAVVRVWVRGRGTAEPDRRRLKNCVEVTGVGQE